MRAVENRHAGQFLLFAGLAHVLLNLVGDKERFVFPIRRFVVADQGFAPLLARGPEVLFPLRCRFLATTAEAPSKITWVER